MTYYWLEDVPDTMTYAAMKNRAGNIVMPSTASVQSAMDDFTSAVEAGT